MLVDEDDDELSSSLLSSSLKLLLSLLLLGLLGWLFLLVDLLFMSSNGSVPSGDKDMDDEYGMTSSGADTHGT